MRTVLRPGSLASLLSVGLAPPRGTPVASAISPVDSPEKITVGTGAPDDTRPQACGSAERQLEIVMPRDAWPRLVVPVALDVLGVGELEVAGVGFDRGEVVGERPAVQRWRWERARGERDDGMVAVVNVSASRAM